MTQAASKGYVLVEGHGEIEAVPNLLARLSIDLGLELPWSTPLRWKNLHKREGITKGAEYIRSKHDARGFLLLRDEDDECPAAMGPEMAAWLRELKLPFPAAVVLFRPEFEVLFLPCLPEMAGRRLGNRPGLLAGTHWDSDDWESRRGIKEWLSGHFPRHRSYKPTMDQLPLTRMINLQTVRKAGVPCFGTLERALAFIHQRGAGEVYP